LPNKVGMCVNETKTEVILFDKKKPKTAIFDINGTQVESKPQMKALGVTFQSDLKWDSHVETIINKVNPRLALLKKIRKNMTVEQFLTVASSQIFSIMYYASQVWLNKTLSAKLWGKLKSLHYRILRAATRDFKRKVSKLTLDKQCKRATPSMWSSYSTCSLAIKILRDRYPKRLEATLRSQLYHNARTPLKGKIYDSSRGKIGRHRLANRLDDLTDLEWNRPWTDDGLRIFLKDKLNFDFN